VPIPKKIEFLNGLDYLEIDPQNFKVISDGNVDGCAIVAEALERYKNKLFFDDVKPSERDDPSSKRRKRLGSLGSLRLRSSRLDFRFECESEPHPKMDEAYELSVDVSSGNVSSSLLRAQTSWGLLRGMETLSQLIFSLGSGLYGVQTVSIEDEPRFSHRGYMLDTARHYISVDKIFNLIDAMAFNKLNVFHWHLVDDQSFPYESSSFPRVSQQASFRPHMVYTQDNVSSIIRYASRRGIRVIPELDSPGHTYSMRYIPNLLTKCYNSTTKTPTGELGPVNPIKSDTYEKISKLVDELSQVFTDPYFHAGGDEVDFECWKSNPKVNRWMKVNNMTGNYTKLSNYYIEGINGILANHRKTMLVWQEAFDDGANLSNDTIVQVWKGINEMPEFMGELNKVVSSGYQALLSSCWYLNYIDYGQDWIKFYKCDPTGEPINKENAHLVLGGEVCMWTEFVDDTNVVSRTWPRASAAAERLWSPKTSSDIEDFLHRLEQMRCRLLYRGIEAEPVNGPGYC